MTVNAFNNRVVVLLLLQYGVPYSVKLVALLPDRVFYMYFEGILSKNLHI